jgi:hypothetical protein
LNDLIDRHAKGSVKPHQIFSWGYWGWGTAAPQLIAAADAAEKQRGFGPPMFVDIRLKRTGRAPGFRGDTFERLLGRKRYRWMPTLGNANVSTGRAARIACPLAADHLLDLALDIQERNRRVIFFCACESPRASWCHRHKVAQLLLRSGRRRDLSVEVEEWPGGKPADRARDLRVSPEILRNVRRGAKVVPLNRVRVPAEFAGLPWGTIAMLKAGHDEYPVAVGPAAYRQGTWVLPRFGDEDAQPAQNVRTVRRQAARLRRDFGLD